MIISNNNTVHSFSGKALSSLLRQLELESEDEEDNNTVAAAARRGSSSSSKSKKRGGGASSSSNNSNNQKRIVGNNKVVAKGGDYSSSSDSSSEDSVVASEDDDDDDETNNFDKARANEIADKMLNPKTKIDYIRRVKTFSKWLNEHSKYNKLISSEGEVVTPLEPKAVEEYLGFLSQPDSEDRVIAVSTMGLHIWKVD